MPQKVKRLEGELSSVQHNQHLMDEIHEIRNDIKMIKSLLISTTKRKYLYSNPGTPTPTTRTSRSKKPSTPTASGCAAMGPKQMISRWG